METSFRFGGEIVWRPTAEHVANSRLRAFMTAHAIPDRAELQRRSVEQPEWFWDAVLRDLGIVFRRPYQQVMDTSAGIAWTRWCVGAECNIVESCLDRHVAAGRADHVAAIHEDEDGRVSIASYGTLLTQTDRLAGRLTRLGVRPGDVVGLLLPMRIETVVALLAVNRVGAIALPLFSGYGESAVAERLSDAGASVLVTADGFARRGKTVRLKAVADAALARCPSVRTVIVVRTGTVAGVPMIEGREHDWAELLSAEPVPVPSVPTGPDDPCLLIYTSGTTGRPKAAVHSHIGFPVKAAADMAHGLDLHADETLFWLTDLGWMMGPWLIYGTLIHGAKMLLYDGAPDWPAPDRLWALLARHRVTAAGVSPTLIRALSAHGEAPVRRHDLSSLRKLASTGEPWTPEAWNWLFHTVGGGRLPIINYSGGTEISGGIVMGDVLSPAKPCSFAGPLPGMAADVVDEQGQPVRGAVGELVIRGPWIGMTRGFWHDPDRYVQTYWSRWPGVWVHGDWAAIDGEGFWYILGRSDDTIKIGGKRLGPAEVEAVLGVHPSVRESAAVGLPDAVKGQTLGCFVLLRSGAEPSETLRSELADRVAAELGKPLRPTVVRFVTDLPRTRNAKIMRRVVRAAWLGEPLGDVGALENPNAAEAVRASV